MTSAPGPDLSRSEPGAGISEVASGLRFPEGPIALPDGSLLCVEVASGTLTRLARAGRRETVADLGGGPNGAAIGPDGHCYVCNNGGMSFHEMHGRLLPGLAGEGEGRIQRVDLTTGAAETLYRTCEGEPLNSPNDLVFDRSGGFWFTDHGKVRRTGSDWGAVFYARADGSAIRRMVHTMHGPNGIGLSPDETQLYVAETPTARIWRFELSGPGTIRRSEGVAFGGRGHLLAGLGGYQWLDSLAVDGRGNVCVATVLNGGITVVSADGRAVRHLPLPDSVTTNLCFGGPGLSTVYATLSSTGRVVSMRWPWAGSRPNFLDRAPAS